MHRKSYKIIQNEFKISWMSCMRVGLALTDTYHLYAPFNHIQNTTSTQEVDGYPGDRSVATISWSENGGKIKNGVSQTDSMSKIPYQISNHCNFSQNGGVYVKANN